MISESSNGSHRKQFDTSGLQGVGEGRLAGDVAAVNRKDTGNSMDEGREGDEIRSRDQLWHYFSNTKEN